MKVKLGVAGTGLEPPKGAPMTTSIQATQHTDSQLTAENLSMEVGDISFTYRRFGDAQTEALP